MGKWSDGRLVWQQAVEQGGLGHTAGATARLEALTRLGRLAGDDSLASLALSTRASLLRQAGRHAAASALDGHALLLAGPVRRRASTWHRAATLDALVGLAADDLGRLRLGAAARLLRRARAFPTNGDAEWFGDRRPSLRIEWVSAELGMYAGDPAAALGHARAALEISEIDGTPERHRVKTLLIAAAADAAAGNGRLARNRATQVTTRARAAGLLPLEWASWALRAGLDGADDETRRQLAQTRAELIRRGVPFEAA